MLGGSEDYGDFFIGEFLEPIEFYDIIDIKFFKKCFIAQTSDKDGIMGSL